MVDSGNSFHATPGHGTSILIWGTGEASMSIFASALARQGETPFVWAHCSPTTDGLGEVARGILVEHSDSSREQGVDSSDLLAAADWSARLPHLIVPESISHGERLRLHAYLQLPPFLQRLASRTLASAGPGVIVLTNIDALPEPFRQNFLAQPEIHDFLHREGVTLVMTFRGSPSGELERVFDAVYAVDSTRETNWAEARIFRQRGATAPGMPMVGPLKEFLIRLGVRDDQRSQE